ncbi:MAG: cyclophane-forming radical SAM/SPASM peptide maturase YhhB [Acidimicrobiales bacterium]
MTTFLVKVASRCNLACDYCYVYEHADQSWKDQPAVMSVETVRRLAERLAEYTASERISRLLVIFHGGEPLIAGAERLTSAARVIRQAMPAGTAVDFSLQTNGLLADRRVLDLLASEGIGVSLSLDGPRWVHDAHRLTPHGRSSFEATMAALEVLEARPDQFTGVISVIDTAIEPDELFAFFSKRRIPQLDLLLPDAHHLRPPPGRDSDPDLYERWLVRAFDVWFDRYPELPVRTFDTVLGAVVGLPGGTDAFGPGDVSLLTIETDGTYHDLDVLKITEHGATALGGGVADTEIRVVATSQRLAAHRSLLRVEGLSATCQACPEVGVCAGGSVPHRFGTGGFDHPTVYCGEMLALIRHARRRLWATVTSPRRPDPPVVGLEAIEEYDQAASAARLVDDLLDRWRTEQSQSLRKAAGAVGEAARSALDGLTDADIGEIALHPGVVAWTKVALDSERGLPVKSLAGDVLRADAGYLVDAVAEGSVEWGVHRMDRWLRVPFGPPIRFEEDEGLVGAASEQVQRARVLIGQHDPDLAAEMCRLVRDIQFVRDESAHPDKYVSFSDDVVPGTLFVSVTAGGGLISVEDLADSLIHEHRHQKLYLLDRFVRLVERDRPLVPSPWREEPRPPSGLLHAAFVFVELRRFWAGLAREGRRADAASQVRLIDGRLGVAWETLAGTALTPAGRHLVEALQS